MIEYPLNQPHGEHSSSFHSSHHRCVMKMDHHCPWINNCCGHLNHAYFTSFLLLAPLGCSHAAIIFIMTMYTQLYDRVGFQLHCCFFVGPIHFTVSSSSTHIGSFACFLTADIIWLEHCKDQHECRSSISAPHTLQCPCLCCYTLCLRFGTGHHYCCWHAFLHTGTFLLRPSTPWNVQRPLTSE